MLDLLEIQGLSPNILQLGFSAGKASLGVSGDAMITNWNTASPLFGGSGFNAAAGTYTVPETGVYALQAAISYVTNSAIASQLGANINPNFAIRRSSPTAVNLIVGQFPVFYTNLVLLSLRTILGSSTVTLSGVYRLTKGDTLGLYYYADGMTISLTLQNVLWTVYPLA